MNRMTRIFFLALSLFASAGASAALFDTIESVDPLKVIAEQRTGKADRMPAGKTGEAVKDDTEAAKATADGKN